jgi:hypothetical protein
LVNALGEKIYWEKFTTNSLFFDDIRTFGSCCSTVGVVRLAVLTLRPPELIGVFPIYELFMIPIEPDDACRLGSVTPRDSSALKKNAPKR